MELEARLSRWRAEHPHFSSEEENLLDELDALWWQFNREELSWLDNYVNTPPIQKTKGAA